MNKSADSRLILALDHPDIAHVARLTELLKDYLGFIKLGLEFFTANGPQGIREIAKLGVPIFLDVKFHDIPNTVASALREAVKLGVQMITIHASGGKSMMMRGIDIVHQTATELSIEPPILLAVTVLTSMDQQDLTQLGVAASIEDQVARLARLADEAGIGGIVCSAHEITLVRSQIASHRVIVTPGIRLASDDHQDQKRVLTPREALDRGANYLVIGRPITASQDPVKTVRSILEDCA